MSERWKPEYGETFWYVSEFAEVEGTTWVDDEVDPVFYESGNCFRTEEEAEAAAEKVKELLLKLHDNGTSTANSETLKGTFIEYLKKCAEIQADIILQKAKEYKSSEQCSNAPEETKLPDWCKVGAIGFEDEYFKIIKINDKSCDVQYLDPHIQDEDGNIGGITFDSLLQCHEARLRPWTAREAIGKVICWQGDYSFQENIATINAVDCDGDPMGDLIGNINLKDLTRECFYQPDGSPCGVLEHLENGKWVK